MSPLGAIHTGMNPRAVRRSWIFLLVALALYGWGTWALATGRRGVSELPRLLGIGVENPGHPLGWALAALVAIVFCWMGMRGYPLIREHLFDWSAMKAAAIVFAMGSGIIEEVWFRQVPMDWLQVRGWSALTQVLIVALVFGAMHGVWGAAARNVRVALASVAATGLLGAGLAVVYLAAGRVVAPCIWSHAAINMVLEPWLLVAAMSRGLEARAPAVARAP
jgi:uncharacterized protein